VLSAVTTPDVVYRPDPGLARGLWEASPSALYVALGVLLVAALLYLLVRRRQHERARRSKAAGRP
jgi:LPXTG-motif cell wall-anchored protein